MLTLKPTSFNVRRRNKDDRDAAIKRFYHYNFYRLYQRSFCRRYDPKGTLETRANARFAPNGALETREQKRLAFLPTFPFFLTQKFRHEIFAMQEKEAKAKGGRGKDVGRWGR